MRFLPVLLVPLILLACSQPASLEPPFLEIPQSYPFTISVPPDWETKEHSTARGAIYQFRSPDSFSVGIAVTHLNPRYVGNLDTEETADLFLLELEKFQISEAVDVESRNTLPDGTVEMLVSVKWRGECETRAVVRVQRTPETAFITEGGSCQGEWDKRGTMLTSAVESFRPKE